MKYNFEEYLNRRESGSSKWLDMDKRNPNVRDGVLPLSVADMEFMTCPTINEKLCEYINANTLGYLDPAESYLDVVVKFFKEYHNYNAKKEWIVTTPGIVQALAASVKSFTEKNDEVIIFTPVYRPFYNVVKEQGRQLIESPLIYKDNEYNIDFGALEKLASRKDAKMILLCNPHNPSGKVWSVEDLMKISKIANKNKLIVVSDEIHADIVFGEKHHTIYGSISEEACNNSIVCTAASKTFNIAGLQCSNIFIANEKLRSKFIRVNENTGIESANTLGRVATQVAYEDCQDWLKEAKIVIEDNNKIVKEFFDSYGSIFRTILPEASFLVWVNFENIGIEHEKFMKFLELECEFFPSNGLSFGEGGRNFFRINTGLPTCKLKENLERLKIMLEKKYSI